MKAQVTIVLENGVLSYAANVGVNDVVTILEAVKHKLISQALGGVGRPADPGSASEGAVRSPGLQARRVDGGYPAVGRSR